MIRVSTSRKSHEKHKDTEETDNSGNLNRNIFCYQRISKI